MKIGKAQDVTAFGGRKPKVLSEELSTTKLTKGCSTDKTPVFGIDLGTTNSAISVIKEGSFPETIKLYRNGDMHAARAMTMPSCVQLKNGEFVIGTDAYEHRDEPSTIYSVKTLMQDTNAKVTLVDEVTGERREMTPAEVSAEILKGLVKETAGVYGEIKDVTVTVPAYFDQNGVNATRKACELAGLNLIAISNEPTAASLNYKLDKEDGGTKTVVIYDLGGGTFDVTAATISEIDESATDEFAALYGIDTDEVKTEKTITCIAIDGDTHLGGDDIDKEMYKIVAEEMERIGIPAHKFTNQYKESVILSLEKLKKSNVKGTFILPIETVGEDGSAISGTVTITPVMFRDAVLPIYKKTRKILTKLFSKVDRPISTLILVGGSTKHLWLREMLKEDFKTLQIEDALNPDLSVSAGAAIHGNIVKFGDVSTQVFDILPISIGVVTEGKVTPVVTQGTQLPTVKQMAFTTVVDNQVEMELEVMQGNSSFVQECVSLGKLLFTDIPMAPAGETSLAVKFTISADRKMLCAGVVNGEIKEMSLNLSGEATETKKLSREEKQVLRWKKTAEKFTEYDRQQLYKMIENYPTTVTADEIMSFIRAAMGELKDVEVKNQRIVDEDSEI